MNNANKVARDDRPAQETNSARRALRSRLKLANVGVEYFMRTWRKSDDLEN